MSTEIGEINAYPVRYIELSEVDGWLSRYAEKEAFLGGIRYFQPGLVGVYEVRPEDNSIGSGFGEHRKLDLFSLGDGLNFICFHGGLEPGHYLIQDPFVLRTEIANEP